MAGIDEGIGTKMCYKLVNDVSGMIICRSVIRLAIEPGTANLQVDRIEPLPDPVTDTENVDMVDEFMLLADFDTPFSRKSEKGPV